MPLPQILQRRRIKTSIATAGPLLTVASYNVHRCIGRDRSCSPLRVLQVIRELRSDIIGLQEVDSGYFVAESFCQRLFFVQNMAYHAVHGTTLVRGTQTYGNLLLSRYPIKEFSLIDLTVLANEPRGAISAVVDYDGLELRIVVAHLGLKPAERRIQLRLLSNNLNDEKRPKVIMGDFNTVLPAFPNPLTRLKGVRARSFVKTFPARLPLLPLDRIIVQPARAVETVSAHRSDLSRLASDHLPIKAVIDTSKLVLE